MLIKALQKKLGGFTIKKSKKFKSILFIIIALKIFGLLYKILTTRILGLDGMRLISMIMPTLALCLSVSSLSIQTVCNQNIASNLNFKTTRISVIMLSCLRVTLISSSIISILMLLSFPIYKYIYQESFIYYPLLLCIPLLFLSNTSGVMKGYLEANNEFGITYFSNLVESLTKLLLTVILLIIFKNKSLEFKTIIVFSCLTLSELSSCLVLSYKIKHKRKIQFIRTNSYERKVLKQAIPLTLTSLSTTISGYITPFVYYYACSKINIDFLESTTYFALVTSYAIPLLISGQYGILTISKFIFPNITKNINHPNQLNSILDKAFLISIVVAIVSFALCFFQAENMLNLMYDDATSAHIVKFLAPIYLFIYFDPIFIVILQSYKKEKSLLWITIISQVITIISIYALSINPFFNTAGYIIGFSIGALLKCIILFFCSLKVTKYKPNLFKYFLFLVPSVCYIALLTISNNAFYYLIISLIYILLCLLFYCYFYSNKLKSLHNMKHK